jgi:hypothetical protein
VPPAPRAAHGPGPVFTAERVVDGLLIGGALVIQLVGYASQLVPPARESWSGNGDARVVGWLDTLLGPEETDASLFLLDFRAIPPRFPFRGFGGWCWLLFENCTVDASIF